MFFNPFSGRITSPGKTDFKLSQYKNKTINLGQEELKLPNIDDNSSVNLGDIPSRIITGILDIGTVEVGVSTAANADPMEHQSQALMRYNFLFTQSLNVMIPSNTNLRAGDKIECLFPRITRGSATEYDTETSGLYMIKELCHHFDANNSYTSLKLIRDTFGIKK